MTREEVNQTLDKLCEYGGMMLDWQYVKAIRIAAVFYETGKDTATKEKQTERKCESCKYHDGRGGCLDSSALCRCTPKQTATEKDTIGKFVDALFFGGEPAKEEGE